MNILYLGLGLINLNPFIRCLKYLLPNPALTTQSRTFETNFFSDFTDTFGFDNKKAKKYSLNLKYEI